MPPWSCLTGFGRCADRRGNLERRRLRLHPEAGGSGRAAPHRGAGRSSGASSSSSVASTTSSGAPRGGGHQRARRHRPVHLEETYRTTLEALGSAIDTRDVGTHAALAAGARIFAGHRPRPWRAGVRPLGHRARRAAARHRQDRDPRRDPLEAGATHAGGVGRDALAPGGWPPALEKIPFLRGAVRDRLPPPRAVGRYRLSARAPRRGDPARRADLRRCRRAGRHDLRSPVLARHLLRDRARRNKALLGHPLRSRRRRHLHAGAAPDIRRDPPQEPPRHVPALGHVTPDTLPAGRYSSAVSARRRRPGSLGRPVARRRREPPVGRRTAPVARGRTRPPRRRPRRWS